MLVKPLFKRADPRQEKIYILREIPNNLLSCERLPNLICATKTRPQAKRYHPWCVSDTSSGLFREQFAASSRKHDIYPSSAIRDEWMYSRDPPSQISIAVVVVVVVV